MHDAPLPCRLDEGIWLEDAATLLPWNTPVDDLRRLCSPEVCESPDGIDLLWRNHVVFRLRGDLTWGREFGAVDPRVYHLFLDTFHFAISKWQGEPSWSVEDITRSFKSTYETLRATFGDATFCHPGYAYTKWASREGSLPSIHWELPTVNIGLSAQFPWHLVDHRKHRSSEQNRAEFALSIRHEPDGYDDLKAAARAYREQGKKSRVAGVVWD